MTNWFHKFFNSHCPECAAERIEKKTCESCSTLKLLLEQERHQNQLLLEKILKEPVIEEPVKREQPEPIRPKFVPWRMKQAELEQADRQKAETLKKKVEEMKMEKVDVKDLEDELGIANSASE